MLTISLLSLTSISQLALFLGIGLIVFGWVEKKQNLILAGHAVLLLLGVFALWVLFGDVIQLPPTRGTEIPKEVKLLGFYRGAMVLMVLTLISGLMTRLKFRFQKVGVAIVVLFALMLFFMLVSIGQMPAV